MTEPSWEVPERALSLTQPWAWLIVSLGDGWKDTENRKPGFSHKSFRGGFLVHAAKRCTASDYDSARQWVGQHVGAAAIEAIPPLVDLPRGGIVGASRIADIVAPGESGRRWHMPDQHGFVLDGRRELPFVPCVGHQGCFWRVPALVREQIRAAVRSGR